MVFIDAVRELLSGDAIAIRRTSWDQGMTVHIHIPRHATDPFTERFFVMKTVKDGESLSQVPWEPGHASIFATDWETEAKAEVAPQ